MNKYKLCHVEVESVSHVYPLDENGNEITVASMLDFDNNESDYYAIFENISPDNFEDWELYQSFDELEDAVKEFKKLIKG